MNKTKLIEALRKTADRIASGTSDYSWVDSRQCNCGQLLQTITGESAKQLLNRQMSGEVEFINWSNIFGHVYLSKWADRLVESGMTYSDIHDLEYLVNPLVRNRVGPVWLDRSNQSHVVIYMNTWATMLEEDQKRIETYEQRNSETGLAADQTGTGSTGDPGIHERAERGADVAERAENPAFFQGVEWRRNAEWSSVLAGSSQSDYGYHRHSCGIPAAEQILAEHTRVAING
jgi:hypothetical protein